MGSPQESGSPSPPQETAFDRARFFVDAAHSMSSTPEGEHDDLVAEAQVYATLAVAEEIRAIREQFTPAGGGTIGEQVGWAVDRIQQAVVDMSHNVSAEAMRASRA